MNSIFKVSKLGACGISIVGLERDNNEYLTDPTIISVRSYTFLQSVSINALTSIKADGTETLTTYGVSSHVNNVLDESDFNMDTDGLYQVTHIILPTDAWLAAAISTNNLTGYTIVYYYDTTAKVIKKYISGVSSIVDIAEVLAVTVNTTTIVRSDVNTFCICKLNDCFYNITKVLLAKYSSTCYNKMSSKQYQIYLRDILWMSINTIKYLLDLNKYYEAQKILEDINQCNAMCGTTVASSGGSCGCNS